MLETPVSKILVLDNSAVYAPLIKNFCDENNLVPLKVRNGSVMSVLQTNIDLGGILYSEDYGGSATRNMEIAAVHLLPFVSQRASARHLGDYRVGAEEPR
jgi:hypothetical protein